MKGYLTTQEAADRLGVTQSRIRQMILDGTITGVEKFGQANMIPEKVITTFSKNRRPPGRPKKNRSEKSDS